MRNDVKPTARNPLVKSTLRLPLLPTAGLCTPGSVTPHAAALPRRAANGDLRAQPDGRHADAQIRNQPARMARSHRRSQHGNGPVRLLPWRVFGAESWGQY